MKKISFVLLAIFAFATIITAQPQNGKAVKGVWHEFISEAENLKVMLPSKPMESSEVVESEIGRVPIKTYSAAQPPNNFTVMVAEYPLSFDTEESSKAVIEAGMTAMTAKMKLENLEQKDIVFGKYPGREVRAKLLTGVMTMRAYVVNNRMYILMVWSDNTSLKSPISNDVRQFFDSFGFIKSPETIATTASSVSRIESTGQESDGPPASFYLQPVSWREFNVAEFGFAVRMPGDPFKETVKINQNDPRLDMHTWMAKGEGSLIYQIAFQQLLAVPEDAQSINMVIENLRDGLAEGVEGKVVSERQITLNGHAGREFRMKSDGLQAIARVYLVGSRVYILNLMTAAGDVSQKDANEFFDSLKVTVMPNTVSATAGTVVETAIWKEIAEPSLGFSVMMPAQPTEEYKNVQDLKIKLLAAKGDGVLCLAGHMFIPGALPSKTGMTEFFRGFSGGFARGMKAKIVGEKEISFDGFPGREFILKNDLVTGYCRVYMVNGHAYMLISMPTLTDGGEKAMAKFFDSFKLMEIKDDQLPPPPPPPPPPVKQGSDQISNSPAPKKIRVSGGVLQGASLKKVQPAYPAEAKAQRIQGMVEIQILVSEDGDVIEATAISGPEQLRDVALNAARQWKFKPTELAGVPVKVQGVLTFNFTLQ